MQNYKKPFKSSTMVLSGLLLEMFETFGNMFRMSQTSFLAFSAKKDIILYLRNINIVNIFVYLGFKLAEISCAGGVCPHQSDWNVLQAEHNDDKIQLPLPSWKFADWYVVHLMHATSYLWQLPHESMVQCNCCTVCLVTMVLEPPRCCTLVCLF